MILSKITYNHGSLRNKTKDLNKNFKLHGLIKSYRQQMILRIIIYNHRSS